MGVQQTQVTPLSRMDCRRASLPMPPPGTQSAPSLAAASKASQKPMKGPKENAKYTRSPAPIPAARKTSTQLSTIQSQLSGVSSQGRGRPLDVPLV